MTITRRKFASMAALAAAGALLAPVAQAQDGVREAIARRHAARRAGAPSGGPRFTRGAASSTPAPASSAPARAAAPAGGHASAAPVSGEQAWRELAEGNRRFVAGAPRRAEVARSRRALARGQHPHAIILSCSDSRVPPELVFDRGLGELFVVRSAGNVTDPIGTASIEYAVEHLHVPLLVVMGHEKCGAVAAAAAGGTMPTPSLAALVRRIAPSVARARARLGGRADAHAEVRMNVRDSADSLLAGSPIIRAAVQRGSLRVVRAVYELESGRVAVIA